MKTLLKQKVCKNCGGWFEPFRPLQNVCTIVCSVQLAKKKTEAKEKKNKAKEDKEWRVRKKELREKLKTSTQFEHDAREVFQEWVRRRDKDLPCISCGVIFTTKWDGGHYFKAELYSGLIFNEDNCHKQCSRCNNELHGNEANYRIGLVKKIGEERVKWLEENKDRLRQYSWTKGQYLEIKKYYKGKVKEMKATV